MELISRIEAFARSDGGRIAYSTRDEKLSYVELAERVSAARSALLEITAGSASMVLHAGNTIDFPIAYLAAMAAGLRVLVIPESVTQRAAEQLAIRIGSRIILSDTLQPFAGEHDLDLVSLTSVAKSKPPSRTFPPPHAPGELLLTTSGSTGVPKLVRRTSASLDAVAANMVEAIGLSRDDHVLAAVPLTHSYGIEHGLLAPLWAGATVHLFDGLDLQAIAACGSSLTVFPAVPSMLERLADASEPLDGLRYLTTIYSAGAPLPEAVRARFTARFGPPIGQLYGSTEIGTVTYHSGDARPGNDVGWPMRGVSIRVVDSGEIAIRSPSMFSAYLDEEAPLIDGHFLTGDLGQVTADGALELVGRSKLLIDVGGLKVNPLEVEAAIATHPQVAECVVLPMHQSETVSRLRAVVVPHDPAAPPDLTALRVFAQSILASHQVPRTFELRLTPLPRSATGKLLRTMLGD